MRDLVGFRPKQTGDHHRGREGGMKEIEGAARSRTDGVGIKALRPSASLFDLSSLFGSGLSAIMRDQMTTIL